MKTKTLDEEMGELIQPDGGLYCLGWYVAWTPGRDEVTLDAEFTADELRWIADYMDRHKRS
jgi:hypothetical protein